MKTETEKFGEKAVIFLSIIGVISIIYVGYNSFYKSDNNTSNVCSSYESEIDDLNGEIEDLKEKITSLKNEKEELNQTIDNWIEQYEILVNQKGCKTGGSAKLTDGASKGE